MQKKTNWKGNLYFFCAMYAAFGIPAGWIISFGLLYGNKHDYGLFVELLTLILYGASWIASIIVACRLGNTKEAEEFRQDFDNNHL